MTRWTLLSGTVTVGILAVYAELNTPERRHGLPAVTRHGGSAERYAQTMRAAAAVSGVRTVIPGHGALMSWQQFVDNVASLGARP